MSAATLVLDDILVLLSDGEQRVEALRAKTATQLAELTTVFEQRTFTGRPRSPSSEALRRSMLALVDDTEDDATMYSSLIDLYFDDVTSSDSNVADDAITAVSSDRVVLLASGQSIPALNSRKSSPEDREQSGRPLSRSISTPTDLQLAAAAEPVSFASNKYQETQATSDMDLSTGGGLTEKPATSLVSRMLTFWNSASKSEKKPPVPPEVDVRSGPEHGHSKAELTFRRSYSQNFLSRKAVFLTSEGPVTAPFHSHGRATFDVFDTNTRAATVTTTPAPKGLMSSFDRGLCEELLLAAKEGDLNRATKLLYGHVKPLGILRRTVDVNYSLENGLTPLHWAILRRDKNMALLLLENGADWTKKSQTGFSAQDLAKRNEAMRQLLISFKLRRKQDLVRAQASMDTAMDMDGSAPARQPAFQET